MTQIPRTPPRTQGNTQHPSLAFFCAEVFASLLLCFAFVLGVSFALINVFGRDATAPVAHAASLKHVQLNLSIVINQPGYQKDWPAYAPNTLVVPANSMVTVTLRDYDLGDTPLPNNSPFTKVQGTLSGVAFADGQAYSTLAPEKVAHTFTIPQLHINVPLPGDGAKGASYDTITFTFRTGAAGSYYFQCFDPCGTGASGWEGPMVTRGYMHGTFTVQG